MSLSLPNEKTYYRYLVVSVFSSMSPVLLLSSKNHPIQSIPKAFFIPRAPTVMVATIVTSAVGL